MKEKENSKVKYVTVVDVAAYWKVHVETVRRWIRAGRMKAKRVDGYKIPEDVMLEGPRY